MMLLDDLAKHQLQEIIDDYSVRAVLAAIEEVCDGEAEKQYGRNGEHLKMWHYAGQEIAKMRLRVQV